MNRLLTSLLILILTSPVVSRAEQNSDDFLADFIAGKYHLIGKSINSNTAYTGSVELLHSDKGITVYRMIDGHQVMGHAAIEEASADQVPVLRIRFIENSHPYEASCLINSDLDNYARLSCYLYLSGVKTDSPGLEALFIDQGKE